MSDSGTPKSRPTDASVFDRMLTRRSFVAATAAVGVAAAVGPSRVFAARKARSTAGQLTIAVPNAPASWDQDYIAFDLTGLALDKNYYPYMVDYGTKSLAGAMVQNTAEVLPIFAESWTRTRTRPCGHSRCARE